VNAAALVRRRARAERRRFVDLGIANVGRAFLESVARIEDITIIPVAHGDVLLQGARAKLEQDGSFRFLYVDNTLAEPAQLFCIAHELGHFFLHKGDHRCHEDDMLAPDEGTAPPLPEDPVAVYHPREQREQEANVFASEFLVPTDDLVCRYVGDPAANSQTLAKWYGADRSLILEQLVAALPPSGNSNALPLANAGREHGAVKPVRHPLSSDLDPSQRAAATVLLGPALVDAGPGTGKTRTLIARATWLVEQQGVPASRILLLTFSNRAAEEMRERLMLSLGDSATEITIATFHAFALEILKRYAERAGLPQSFRLIDELEARLLLRKHLSDLPLHHYQLLGRPDWFLPDLQHAISRAKDELVNPAAYADLAQRMAETAGDDPAAELAAAKAAEVAAVYAVYQGLLQRYGLLDFGDLLVRAVGVVQEHPSACAELQTHYQHLLVDEYQDTNRASGVLLRAIAGEGEGLWVVGDPRQSIYRFRGASPENVHHFSDDFPNAKLVRLTRNYRSVAPLVDIFGRVATSLAAGSEPVTWEAQRQASQQPITWAVAGDQQAERKGVVSSVVALRKAGVAYRDQAVLCRTHVQAERMAAALEQHSIPVSYQGNLFARSEVKDLLAVLTAQSESGAVGVFRLLRNEADEDNHESLMQFLRAREPTRVHRLIVATLGEALEQLDLGDREVGVRHLIASLDGLEGLSVWQVWARYLFDTTELGRSLFQQSGVAAAQVRIALFRLFTLARGFAQQPGLFATGDPRQALLGYVRFLVESGDSGPRALEPDDSDGVRILTAHASKGLEFEAVILPHLARGEWPAQHRSETCPDPPGLSSARIVQEHDEAYLFFVALTRARTHLVLCRSNSAGTRKTEPSEFWQLVEPHLEPAIGTPECWPDDTGEPGLPEATTRASAESALHIRDLEMYVTCPRRFYYERMAKLHASTDDQGVAALHRCIRAVVHALSQRHATGALPLRHHELEEILDVEWSASGPRQHPYAAVYRRQALDVVTRAWSALSQKDMAPVRSLDVTVRLPHASINLPIDGMEEHADGSVTLVRRKTGKPSTDDTREHRVALYHRYGQERQADGQGAYQVEIDYIGAGVRKTVPPDRPSKAKRSGLTTKLDELDSAAVGIATRRFPAQPGRQCLTCGFNLICPA
jgi:superfamily I DNA/RNA helicase